VTRLPIRLRLALSFAVAAAVLLAVVGTFGYVRLSAGLSHDLDLELRQRAQDLIVPVSRSHASLTRLAGTGFVEHGESFVEIVTPSGRVVDATRTLKGRPLLTASEAARAAQGTMTVDRPDAPGLNEPARLLATPFTRGGQRLVLVVGDTRENGLEVLRRVRDQLVVGLTLLVLLTSLGAYAVAGAALRPVEAMRRRASELTTGDASLRLPVPPSTDEIARLGTTLNALLARVEETLDRERSFVAHASHELRTPLALLRTQLELAVRRPRPAAELEEAIRSARLEVDRLERLTEDLLVLAEAGESGLALHLDDISVGDLFAEIAARFDAACASAGRRLVVASAEGVVRGDHGRLTQAFTNLVGNALEHGSGDVVLEARHRDGHVDLVVRDSGGGFTPDLLETGTERFVRGPASTGSGLGLAIVAAIAQAHGGAVLLRNVDGGAEVRLSVPAAEVGRARTPEGRTAASGPAVRLEPRFHG
jgi:two-component system, OmpR family, sensor kinase